MSAPTPMMAQYLALKEEAGDCLLFYRMGDFFELFFEDAKIASGVLDIALTARGEHEGERIPTCGVPVHAMEGYLARLIKAGHRVAIAEQTETPEAARKRIEAHGGSFFMDLPALKDTLYYEEKYRDPEGVIFDISGKGWVTEAS